MSTKMKTAAEEAADAAKQAGDKSKALIAKLENGDFLEELVMMSDGDVEKMQGNWRTFYTQVRESVEDYNAKVTEAKNQLRQVVTLAPLQIRGPGGESTVRSVGPFTVTSVTKRSFDAAKLIAAAKAHGILERILELTAINKEGQPYRLVQEEWSIDFLALHNWLKEHNYSAVITAAYVETESTPQVRGPKELSLLGDAKKA